MAEPEVRQSWHLGKEIPLTLIAGIIMQSIVFAIWLSRLSTNVENLAGSMVTFNADRFTGGDAKRERELMDLRFNTIYTGATEQARRMGELETRLQQLERNSRR